MLNNIPIIVNNSPSIIDYVVNIGLKSTSDQWIYYLSKEGIFAKDLYLKSILEELNNDQVCKIYSEIFQSWIKIKNRCYINTL